MPLLMRLILVTAVLLGIGGGVQGSVIWNAGKPADEEQHAIDDEQVRELQRTSRTKTTPVTIPAGRTSRTGINTTPATIRTSRTSPGTTSRTNRGGTDPRTSRTSRTRAGRIPSRTSRGGTTGGTRTGRDGITPATTTGRDRGSSTTTGGSRTGRNPTPETTRGENSNPKRFDDPKDSRAIPLDCVTQDAFFGIGMTISNLLKTGECKAELEKGLFAIEVERTLQQAENFMGNGATHITPLNMTAELCNKQTKTRGIWEAVGGGTVKYGCKPDFDYANENRRYLMESQDASDILASARDPTYGHLLIVYRSLLMNILRTNLIDRFKGICFPEHAIPDLAIQILPNPPITGGQTFFSVCAFYGTVDGDSGE